MYRQVTNAIHARVTGRSCAVGLEDAPMWGPEAVLPGGTYSR